MAPHELAGKPAPPELLIDTQKLLDAYFTNHPDPADPAQRVSFGTSGHRGSSFRSSFNEDHILAVTQAVCEYRASAGINGPLYMGMDTHALSGPAQATALEVMAAAGVEVMIQQNGGYTPTPTVSHAILTYNQGRSDGLADGIVVTPSHNPPDDGGFKYNPPHGGPAGTEVTSVIEKRANEILAHGCGQVKRMAHEQALKAPTTHQHDFVTPYISDLPSLVDLAAVAKAGVKIGVDPLGGASVAYWQPLAEMHGLDLEVVNPTVDPTFSFMTVDKDGKIRMDCSSPYAMAGLIAHRDRFDIAFGTDPDCDRHGIVTRGAGLLNPNHYLSVAIWYLFQNRIGWSRASKVGKTLVSSSMIDRVAASLGRELSEVPVGFKWFVDGLIDGSYGFGGEESAGASFLRMNGKVWTTDKDGIVMDLLAAEICAKMGRDPGELYDDLAERFGRPVYERLDAPASTAQKAALKALSPEMVTADTLAGELITARLTHAPGNGAAIGGLKVTAENGWFAARPSGTEAIYKIYSESFQGAEHLKQVQADAQAIVAGAFKAAGLA